MRTSPSTILLLLTLGCRGADKEGDVTQPGDDGAGDDGGTGDDGNTGDDGGDDTDPSDPTEPWQRKEVQAPGTLTFNEVHYHPGTDQDLEWIELRNPMVLDVDLSGWSLQGGVSWAFPEGTVLPAGGYLVVAASPRALEAETGFTGALGPYTGRLANGGERIELRGISGRLMDTLAYRDDAPWPVHPDGSGFTLAKIAPDAASDHAENWTVSAERGGTPGAANHLDPKALPTVLQLVELEATWRYDSSGAYPSEDWAETETDDSAWESGQAVFYAGGSDVDVLGTAWATADNYFALYLGNADGSELRWVGEDTDGSWTTVEELELEVRPTDHLYLAAWELAGDSGSPQMLIAEVALDGALVGTDASAFEWVLGPVGDNPGGLPGGAPPDAADLALLIDEANTTGTWDLPAVERSRSSSPWGSTVGSAFTDAAAFIWADTFSGNSITNSDDTYALFRSAGPILPSRGNLELTELPTTLLFRTDFAFTGSLDTTTLHLDCVLDDGAVVYLNGVEVLRENMPEGDVDAETLAWAEVGEALALSADISADALLHGLNVLAVELHQATLYDADMTFGCALTAETSVDPAAPTLVLNEIAAAGESPTWVELANISQDTLGTEGRRLATSGGQEVSLAATSLAPGALLALENLDLDLEAGDRLFLLSADGETLYDAVRVGSGLRARAAAGGPWRVPTAPSPGEDNPIVLTEDIVINELMYHRAPLSQEGSPVTDRDEEWIELFNRGEDAVDLGGWQLVDAVAYAFPEGTELAPGDYLVVARDAAAMRGEHPGLSVLGDYDGSLDNGGDRVLLLDAVGNPADEVPYFDGGRWPGAADGGGASLELRDPWADNAVPEAWAASDETARSSWQTVTLRGVAEDSVVGPDGVWEELVLGLLDAGEVLLDDLRVIQDPDTAAVELLQNGDFEGDALGPEAQHWRLLGTHRHSGVVTDPDDPGNQVLRLVATGPAGHMHNHAETTLLQPVEQREVEVSFRARWISGSNQLNARLYFNRLPHTVLLAQPAQSGTPGAVNSTRVDNLGPTFADLAQDVVVPDPGEAVQVGVSVQDPDGVAAVRLWSSVDGGVWSDVAMDEATPGRWEAELPGQAAGALVQLYVEAEDSLGQASTFPAAGPDSHALYRVDDGQAATTGLHTFRILMTEAASNWLHQDVNLMSDDLVGATVVYNEAEIFYDVGVRLKGSQRGRPTAVRIGYGVRFNEGQPFRGSHTSVMLDRSEGVGFGQREVLQNLMMTRAGSVSGEYNDLVQLVAPVAAYTSSAELQLDRFSNLVLDAQFADGGSGTRFEYELIYYPTTTADGTEEGLKLPQPDRVIGTAITDLGEDKEAYRWNFLIKNNARQDDYATLMDLCQTFALPDDEFLAAADSVIDVDQWLRAFAFSTLTGATDQYGGAGSQHNVQFYVRPEDGRVLFFPHDLDFIGGTTMPVVGNNDLARLLEDPANARSYYGHLNDIIETSYNTAYLGRWCDQLGALLPGQNFDGHCDFIGERVAFVQSGSSASVRSTFPEVDFAITTGGGEDFNVSTPNLTLEGQAWIDVRTITLDGSTAPLDLTWLDGQTWQLSLPLERGENALTLVARDLHGAMVGTDAIVVTRESGP